MLYLPGTGTRYFKALYKKMGTQPVHAHFLGESYTGYFYIDLQMSIDES